jgi:hypothetical protein
MVIGEAPSRDEHPRDLGSPVYVKFADGWRAVAFADELTEIVKER